MTLTSDQPDEFGTALRNAIRLSGLSLSEISRLLRENKTPVSPSSLSYWQNGENRPERANSLAAVTALEVILGLEPATLIALLGPRKPRGRSTSRSAESVTWHQFWTSPETVRRALAKVDATPDDLHSPRWLSQHLSFRVGRSGREESLRARRMLMADRDDTTRFVLVYRYNTLSQPPVVTSTQGCRLSRFRADVPSATCVFEFLLDQPLAAGELAVVEYTLRYPPGQTDEYTQISLAYPTRDLIMQVTFDPSMPPQRCSGYFRPCGATPVVRKKVTYHPETCTYQFITLDPVPGQYGLEWGWR